MPLKFYREPVAFLTACFLDWLSGVGSTKLPNHAPLPASQESPVILEKRQLAADLKLLLLRHEVIDPQCVIAPPIIFRSLPDVTAGQAIVRIGPLDRLPKLLPALVLDLQRLMRQYPQWELTIEGLIDYRGSEANQIHIGGHGKLEFSQLKFWGSLENALIQNAHDRLRDEPKYAELQENRERQLQECIRRAFARGIGFRGEPRVIAWFDTAGDSGWDWKIGDSRTSVWIAFDPALLGEECETAGNDFLADASGNSVPNPYDSGDLPNLAEISKDGEHGKVSLYLGGKEYTFRYADFEMNER